MARKGFEVEGLREFQRAVRKSVDKDLPKRLGQANKRVGQLVISKLQPRPSRLAVGEGRGASIRASASKRDVILRVGGAHRTGHAPEKQWGRNVVRPFRHAPKRPHIIGTARRHEREVIDLYLQGIAEAMDPAFHEVDTTGAGSGSPSGSGGGVPRVEYTTKVGTTRLATPAQIANWTRGSR